MNWTKLQGKILTSGFWRALPYCPPTAGAHTPGMDCPYKMEPTKSTALLLISSTFIFTMNGESLAITVIPFTIKISASRQIIENKTEARIFCNLISAKNELLKKSQKFSIFVCHLLFFNQTPLLDNKDRTSMELNTS